MNYIYAIAYTICVLVAFLSLRIVYKVLKEETELCKTLIDLCESNRETDKVIFDTLDAIIRDVTKDG